MKKRLFDLAIVLGALPLWFPLFLITCIAVRFRMGKPVFFQQMRPGLHGKPFVLWKFRTMKATQSFVGGQNAASELERLTPFGNWLRRSSLDELPELFNVLKGDMSLVGPRPLLMQYLGRYSPVQMKRHEAKPGLTGWAQVHGRNSISWEEKFKLDVWYVQNQSFFLDLKILALTVLRVLKQDGVNATGELSMPEFKGIEQERAVVSE
ncbi:MAG: sugar transferase [Verrucomicrobiales bacterium]